MKITVCELPDETARREAAWSELVRHLRAHPTDVVVLPEMPFCEWAMFRKRTVDLAAWRSALAAHDAMMTRLGELETGAVFASRPVELGGKRLNQSFAWTREGGYRGARAKYYLPEEPDGWEASWFDRGSREFSPVRAGALSVGFRHSRSEILLETTADSPFLTAEVDLTAVDRARQTYPRNLVIPRSGDE